MAHSSLLPLLRASLLPLLVLLPALPEWSEQGFSWPSNVSSSLLWVLNASAALPTAQGGARGGVVGANP